jgi:anti-sigma B factor antagonist
MFDAKTLDNGEVLLSGRLDASQAEKADKLLAEIVNSRTLNFSSLEYISSAGLGILLKHQKRLNSAGYALKLLNLNKHIRDVFAFTGFDKIFEVG